jgi:hypothetical protein
LQIQDNDKEEETDEEDDDSSIKLKTNAEYIKMLRELEDLALVRGNEAPFKALEQAAQSVKTILRLEHNSNLQQRTIDTFFKPKGVITREESDVESEGGSGYEPVGFYGFGDEDDMNLDE